MLSANFKPKRTAAASRGFLATARLSCYSNSNFLTSCGRFYASASDRYRRKCVRDVRQWDWACFRVSVRPSVRAWARPGVRLEKFVSAISNKLTEAEEISPNFGWWCSSGDIWPNKVWRSTGRGHGRYKVRYLSELLRRYPHRHLNWASKCHLVL